MFKELGLQMYTVRDYFDDKENAELAFKKMAESGYSQLHTAGWKLGAEYLAELCKKYNMSIVGTHYNFDSIINNPEKTISDHKLVNTTNIGIGGMPQDARIDAKHLHEFIDSFNKAAQMYAKEGFKCTYHNHNFEFLTIDGNKTMMDILVEELDPKNITFVLDTCWVAAGCGDVREWIEKLAGRIDILHLKDVKLVKEDDILKPIMTEIGSGRIYWDAVLETAEKTGVKYYVVEQDRNFASSAFESIEQSARYLDKYRIK